MVLAEAYRSLRAPLPGVKVFPKTLELVLRLTGGLSCGLLRFGQKHEQAGET